MVVMASPNRSEPRGIPSIISQMWCFKCQIPADFRGGPQLSSCRSEVAFSESPDTDLRFQTPFEAMFKLPANDSGPEGSSDDNPIVLEQINEHEFRGFLRVLYPR